MNKPTTINLVFIVVGALVWTPVILSMIQGANLRPMLHTLFFLVMFFMVPATLVGAVKTWEKGEGQGLTIIFQLAVLIIAIVVTVGPFFIMPMLGYRFGK